MADGISTATVTATLTDTKGNPLDAQEISFSASGFGSHFTDCSGNTYSEVLGAVTLTTNAQGTAAVCVASNTAEAKLIRVEQRGTVGFAIVTFVAGPADVSKSTFTWTPPKGMNPPLLADGKADANDGYQLEVQLLDANGNPVPNQLVIVGGNLDVTNNFCAGDNKSLFTAACTTLTNIVNNGGYDKFSVGDMGGGAALGTTNAFGIFTTAVSSIIAGSQSLSAHVMSSGLVMNSSKDITFVAQTPSQACSAMTWSNYSTGNSTPIPASSHQAQLTMLVGDENCNFAPGAPIVMSDGADIWATFSGSFDSTDDSGVMGSLLNSTVIGTHEVTAEVGGCPIGPSKCLKEEAWASFTLSANVPFVAGAPDANFSSITASPRSVLADGLSKTTLLVSAIDSFGNPVAGQYVSLRSRNGTVAADTFGKTSGLTDSKGNLTTTLASKIVGTDAIEAIFCTDSSCGEIITQVSTTMLFTPNDQVTIATDKHAIIDDGTTAATLTITVTSLLSKARLANQPVTVYASGNDDYFSFLASDNSCTNYSTNTVAAITCQTNSNGQIVVSLASDVEETKTVTAFVGAYAAQTEMPSGPSVELVFYKQDSNHQQPSSDQSTFVASLSPVAADGTSTATLYLLVLDSFGMPVAGQGIWLRSDNGDITTRSGRDIFGTTSGTTDSNGVFSTTLASFSTGMDGISATLADPACPPGQPCKVAKVFLWTNVDFEDIAPLTEQVTLTSGPAVLADGTSTLTLSLAATDGSKLNSALAGALFDFSANGSGKWEFTDCNGIGLGSSPSVNADDSGHLSICLVSDTVGEMLVTAMDDDTGLSAFAPVTFISGPANSDKSTIDPSPTVAVANSTAAITLTVWASDQFGNPVGNQFVSLSSTSGASDSFGAMTGHTNPDGLFTTTVTSKAAACDTITATFCIDSTCKLQSGAVTTTVTFLPSAQLVFVQSVPLIAADNSSSWSLYISESAEDGTPIVGDVVTIAVSGSNNTLSSGNNCYVPVFPASAISCTTDNKGQVSISLSSSTPEVKQVTVSSDDVPATGPNFPVDFYDPNAKPNSKSAVMIVSPSALPADGTTTTTVFVYAGDQNGNPLAGVVVSLSSDNGDLTTSGPDIFGATGGETDAQGIFSTTLASTATGGETIYATLNPGNASLSAQVFFSAVPMGAPAPGPAPIVATGFDQAVITFQHSMVIADGTAMAYAQVTVVDGNATPLGGWPINIASTGSKNTFSDCLGNTYGSTISQSTDSNGQFIFCLSSWTAETKLIDVVSNDAEVVGRVTFLSGAPDEMASFLLVGKGDALADGIDSIPLIAQLMDSNGNGVAGQTVGITSDLDMTNTNAVYNFCASGLHSQLPDVCGPMLAGHPNRFSVGDNGGTALGSTDSTGVFATQMVSIVASDQKVTASWLSSGLALAPTGFSTGRGVSFSAQNLKASETCSKILWSNSQTGDHTPISADGVGQAQINLILADENCNYVNKQLEDGPMALADSADAWASFSPSLPFIRDQADGTGWNWETMLRSTISGMHRVTPPVSLRVQPTPALEWALRHGLAANIPFAAGAPDAEFSSMTASPSTVAADGVATTTLRVSAVDGQGNGIANLYVSLSSRSGGADTFGAASGHTDAHGHFTTTLASVSPGTDTIEALFCTDNTCATTLSAVSTNVFFSLDDQITITTDKTSIAADGISTATLTITAKSVLSKAVLSNQPVTIMADGSDDFFSFLVANNACTNYSSSSDIGIGGAITCQTNANGRVVVSLASDVFETKTVTAFAGSYIAQSGPVGGRSVELDFYPPTPGEQTPDPRQSTFITSMQPVLDDGVTTTSVYLLVLDRFGSPVAGQTITLSSDNGDVSNNSGPDIFGAVTGVTDSRGSFTTTVASTVPGAESVYAALGTAPYNPNGMNPIIIGDAPEFLDTSVDFESNAAAVTEQIVFTAGAPVIADGKTLLTLSLTATDGTKTNAPIAGQLFSFAGNGSGCWTFTDCNGNNLNTNPEVLTDLGGHIALCLYSSSVGEMLVTANDENSGMNAFVPVTFISGAASGDNSELDVSLTPLVGNGTAQTMLTVWASDTWGNPVGHQYVSFSSMFGANDKFGAAGGYTNADGLFSTTLSSTMAGPDVITATFCSDASCNTKGDSVSNTVTFLQSATLTLVQDGTYVAADGVATSGLTLSETDQDGNPVVGDLVTVKVTGSNNTLQSKNANCFVPVFPASAITCATDGFGNVSVALSSTTPETKLGAVSSANVTTGAPTFTVQFYDSSVPPDSSTSFFAASPSTLPGDGVTTTTLFVFAGDKDGNPLPNFPVSLASDNNGGRSHLIKVCKMGDPTCNPDVFGAVTGQTNSAGIFTTTLASTMPGSEQVYASVGPQLAGGKVAETKNALQMQSLVTFTLAKGSVVGGPDPIVSISDVANVAVTVQHNEVRADGIAMAYAEALVTDSMGLPIGSAKLKIEASGSNNVLSDCGRKVFGSFMSGQTDKNGNFIFCLASTTAEAKLIEVQSDGHGVGVAPVTFVTGLPGLGLVGTVFTVKAADKFALADGIQLVDLYVQLSDATGNPVPNQTVQITSDLNLLGGGAGINNFCATGFRSQLPAVCGPMLNGSPNRFSVGDIGGAAVGTTDATGTFHTQMASLVAGTQNLTASWMGNGLSLGDYGFSMQSPVTFLTVGPASPSCTKLAWNNLKTGDTTPIVADGIDQAGLQLLVADANCNFLVASKYLGQEKLAGMTPRVSLSDSSIDNSTKLEAKTATPDLTTGILSGRLAATKVLEHTVVAKLFTPAVPVGVNPRFEVSTKVEFAPGAPSAKNSTLTLSAMDATQGQTVTATFTAVDQYGNGMLDSLGNLESARVHLYDQSKLIDATGLVDRNGQFSATIKNTQCLSNVTDRIIGAALGASSNELFEVSQPLQFVAPIEPSSLTLKASPTMPLLGQAVQLTATLLDGCGNPLQGVAISCIATDSSGKQAGMFRGICDGAGDPSKGSQSDASGHISGFVTPLQMGTVTVTAQTYSGPVSTTLNVQPPYCAFSTPPELAQRTAPVAVASGDFDQDDNADIVVADSATNSVGIMLDANGDGTFSAPTLYPVGLTPVAMVSDRFGAPSKIIAPAPTALMAVRHAKAKANSAKKGALATKVQNFTAKAGTFAGKFSSFAAKIGALVKKDLSSLSAKAVSAVPSIDVAVAGVDAQGEGWVSVLLNDGNMGLQAPQLTRLSGTPLVMTSGQIFGNYEDLLVVTQGVGANKTNATVSILQGNADRSFLASVDALTIPDFRPTSLLLTDFDADGYLDLAVGGEQISTSTPAVMVWLGNGNGTFGHGLLVGQGNAAPTYLFKGSAGGGSYAIASDDFDGDGNLDLAWAATSDTMLTVAFGDGTGKFIPAQQTGTALPIHPVAISVVNSWVNNLSKSISPSLAVLGDDGSVKGNPTPGSLSLLFSNGSGNFSNVNEQCRKSNAQAQKKVGGQFVASSCVTSIAVGVGPVAMATFADATTPFVDLVTANLADNDITVLQGDGTGGLIRAANTGADGKKCAEATAAVGRRLVLSSDLVAPSAFSTASADLDGDGVGDAIVTSTNGASIFFGDGNGGFASPMLVSNTAAITSTSGSIAAKTDSAGAVEVTVSSNWLSKDHISVTPSVVGPRGVEFAFGAGTSPATLTLTSSQATVIADGKSNTTLVATLVDANGRALSGKTVSMFGWGVALTGSAGSIGPTGGTLASGNTDATGRFSTALSSWFAQTALVRACIDDTCAFAETQFVAGPPLGQDSDTDFEVSPQNVTPGQPVNYFVNLLDAQDNPIADREVTISAQDGYTTTARTDSAGNLIGSYTPRATYWNNSLPDYLSLSVTNDSTFVPMIAQLTANPVKILPRAYALSLSSSASSIVADGDTATTITVTVLDLHGNAVSGVPVHLETWASGPRAFGSSGDLSTTGTTNVDGQLVDTLTDTAAEPVTILVQTQDGSGLGAFGDTRFVPGPANATTSLFWSTGGTLPVNGTATALVVLRDANGNLIPNQTVTFSTTGTTDTFTAVPLGAASQGSGLFGSGSAIAIADMNSDGVPDLIGVDQTGSLMVMLGSSNGSGGANGGMAYLAPACGSSSGAMAGICPGGFGTQAPEDFSLIAALDLNHDGAMDLVLAGGSQAGVQVLLGATANAAGSLSLTNGGTFAPQIGVANAIATGDFNQDGVPDIAVASGSVIDILQGRRDGTFYLAQSYEQHATITGMVAVDLNGDGALDLAFVGPGTAGSSAGWLGTLINSGGTFAPINGQPVRIAMQAGTQSIATGDYNGDGFADLAVTNSISNSTTVAYGAGDGTILELSNLAVGMNPQGIATYVPGLAAGQENKFGAIPPASIIVANRSDKSASVISAQADCWQQIRLETSYLTDVNNCGRAKGVCDGDSPICANGVCFDVANDAYNCGTVGNQCVGTTPACSKGSCFDLSIDPANCGGVGKACDPGNVCSSGSCVAATLVYASNSYTCVLRNDCVIEAPNMQSKVKQPAPSGFAVSPPLPSGLWLNPDNGKVVGVALVDSAATLYTISTASGASGTFTLAVVGSGIPLGWIDVSGNAMQIPVGRKGTTDTTWSCEVVRVGTSFANNGGTPCDGADGTSPFLVMSSSRMIASQNSAEKKFAPAYLNDGEYSYRVVETNTKTHTVVQNWTGSVYMHHDLDQLDTCQPEATVQELLDFANNNDNVPDCNSWGLYAKGACLVKGNYTFDSQTNLAAPTVTVGFDSSVAGDGAQLNWAWLMNWVLDPAKRTGGYGSGNPNAKPDPKHPTWKTGDVSCGATSTLQSLRHQFVENSSGSLIVEQRVYPGRKSDHSCRNQYRTGQQTAVVNNSVRPRDPLDCSAGELFDPLGNEICVKRDENGKLYVSRYARNSNCTLGHESLAHRRTFSPKTTNPADLDCKSNPNCKLPLYIPDATSSSGVVTCNQTVCTGNMPVCSSGVCYDLSSDINNCGSIGNQCSGDKLCQVGACTPAALHYTPSDVSCVLRTGCSIPAPSNAGGTPSSFSVSPALPAGLTIDTTSGAISGTPLANSASTTYTVTAASYGAGVVNIAVIGTPLPLGWLDSSGGSPKIPVGVAAANTSWHCQVVRSSTKFLAGVQGAPCDGKDGTTPFLAMTGNRSIASTNPEEIRAAPAFLKDGSYSYKVTELNTNTNAVIRQWTGTVYMHHDLDRLATCTPEASVDELLAFVKDNNNVPDCSTWGAYERGPCLVKDKYAFSNQTALAAPFLTFGFDKSVAGDGAQLNWASVMNWVLGKNQTDLFRGYDLKCSATPSMQSLRHQFIESGTGGFIVEQRVYPQRDGKHAGSCANVHRTGMKNGVLDGNFTKFSREAGKNPDGSPFHGADRVVAHYRDGNVDIDCSAGEVFDPLGNEVCVKRDTHGQLYVSRFARNSNCELGSTSPSHEISYSPKSLEPTKSGYDLYLPDAPTMSDPNNCGGIGKVCGGTEPVCSAGSCFDLWSDNNNCGSVGNACGGGTSCSAGTCVSLSNDPNNCGKVGKVGNVCGGATPVCSGGNCYDVSADNSNCGSVGYVCGQYYNCASGNCVDDMSRDPNNCGTQGNVCSGGTPACVAGSCAAALTITIPGHADVLVSCAEGDFNCQAQQVCNQVTSTTCLYQQYDPETGGQGSWYPQDGVAGPGNVSFGFIVGFDFWQGQEWYGNIYAGTGSELGRYGISQIPFNPRSNWVAVSHWQRQGPYESDINNCGSSGNVCNGTTPDCFGGVCVDLSNDPLHCGAEMNVCVPNDTCTSAECVPDTTRDPDNCGTLGNVCTGGNRYCYNGNCLDLSNDANNCGWPNTKCAGDSPVCAGNQCYDVAHDDKNCGSFGNVCAAYNNCVSGTCVDDMTRDPNNCGSPNNRCGGSSSVCVGSACSSGFPAQCDNYLEINDSTRAESNSTYAGPGRTCDTNLPYGWYRVTGTYNQIPTTATPQGTCGTNVTGWLDFANPATPGETTTGSACWAWNGNSCYWNRPGAQITNCGSYNVYYLNSTPTCDARFCVQ